MKLKYKKLIAREFLYLLSLIIISTITYFIFSSLIDSLKQSKEEHEALKVSDTLAYRLKLFYITEEVENLKNNKKNSEYIRQISDLTKYPDIDKFIYNLKKSEIANEFLLKTKIRFDLDSNTELRFKNKLKKDTNNSENLLYKIKESENSISKKENSFFYSYSNLEVLIMFIFLILFPFRYIIYSTIWSIKQIRIKENE